MKTVISFAGGVIFSSAMVVVTSLAQSPDFSPTECEKYYAHSMQAAVDNLTMQRDNLANLLKASQAQVAALQAK